MLKQLLLNVSETTILYFIIVILLGLMMTTKCNPEKEVVIIEIPEVPGTFDNIPITEKDSVSTDPKTVIDIVKPIIDDNKKKVEDFKELDNDSKVEEYSKTIEPKVYQDTVEDDNLKLNYSIVTKGTLEDFKIDYLIKSKTKDVEVVLPSKSHLLYGGSIRSNTSLENVNLNLNLGLQTKSGNIIYVTYGTDNYVSAGYMRRF